MISHFRKQEDEINLDDDFLNNKTQVKSKKSNQELYLGSNCSLKKNETNNTYDPFDIDIYDATKKKEREKEKSNNNEFSEFDNYLKQEEFQRYDEYQKHNAQNAYNNMPYNINDKINVNDKDKDKVKFKKIYDMNLKFKQTKNEDDQNLSPRKSSLEKVKSDDEKPDSKKQTNSNCKQQQPQQPLEYESRRKVNKVNVGNNYEKGKLDQGSYPKYNQPNNTLIQVKQDINEIYESRRNIKEI